jgi:RecA-family ATPase
MTTAKEGTTNYGEFPKDKQAEHAEKQPRFKDGHSLAWYAKQPIDPAQTLLGNRYLCRTGGMFIVAPSGMGKSTLSLQMAVLWCCGLVAFGVKPSKALRILIVQSEDDQGDCTEMTKVINHLKLSGEQKILVEENTKLISCNDLAGYRFIQALEAELMQANGECKPFDLVIINPYGVFLGADAKDVDACTQFLNTWINPLLSKFAIGVILIHHTPKTNFRDTTDWKPSDWMCSGAGASVMTNWARAYLAIDPCVSSDFYNFIAAKCWK